MAQFWITEGSKKADAATSHGLLCISLAGVSSFGLHPEPGMKILDDWQALPVNGNEWVIAFDSDARSNHNVARARNQLTSFIHHRGGTVRWANIPPAADGGKQGLDDYLAARSVEELTALVGPPDENPLVALPMSDAGNGERFAYQFHEYASYVKGVGWHEFNGVWHAPVEAPRTSFVATMRATEEVAVKLPMTTQRQDLIKWALQSENLSRTNAALKFAEQLMQAEVTDFNRQPHLFNCLNCTIDLRTGQAQPHDPADRLTQICRLPYVPEATCPLWERQLSFMVNGDAEMLGYLQRFFGYCLTGEISEKMLMFFVGEGDTGKTTISRVLEEVMGPDYLGTLDEATLGLGSRKRSGSDATADVAALVGKRVVLASETPADMQLNVERVKHWTGGNSITARNLFKDPITFPPVMKPIIETNDFPGMKDGDTPLWNRVHIVEFTRVVPLAEQDKNLKEKLRAEYPGILAWMIRGTNEWYQVGLQRPAKMAASAADYKKDSDPVIGFIQEMCDLGDDFSMPKESLYAAFKFWSEGNGDRYPIKVRAFNKRVQEQAISSGGNRIRLDERAWRGIRLKELPVMREANVIVQSGFARVTGG